MHAFKDAKGRSWEITINVGQVKRVRGLLGLDLYTVVDDGAKGLGELMADPCRLVDALFVLTQEQCQKEGVSDEDFGRLFAGDVLDQASEAFLQELVDFFPAARGRAGLKNLLDKSRSLGSKLMDRAEKELGEIDLDKAADLLVAKLKSTSGKSPANSASTLTIAP